MRKLLLCFLSVLFITSCTDEVIQSMEENQSEEAALRAASAVHPLDRSLTIPLWEYVSLTPSPRGYYDYYYQTSTTTPNQTISVNNRNYKRVRMVGRIFQNPLTGAYNHPAYSVGVTIWYSAAMKRHRITQSTMGSGGPSYPDFDSEVGDYLPVRVLGYVAKTLYHADREIYEKEGMLEYHSQYINWNIPNYELRFGKWAYFAENYGLGVWTGLTSIGFIYAY